MDQSKEKRIFSALNVNITIEIFRFASARDLLKYRLLNTKAFTLIHELYSKKILAEPTSIHFLNAINKVLDQKEMPNSEKAHIIEYYILKWHPSIDKLELSLTLNFAPVFDALKRNTSIRHLYFKNSFNPQYYYSNPPNKDGNKNTTDLQGLCEMMKENKGVKRLNLSNCRDLGKLEVLTTLCESLMQNSTLEEIVLSSCDINDEGMHYVENWLTGSKSMRKLEMNRAKLMGGGLASIANILNAHTSLTDLVFGAALDKKVEVEEVEIFTQAIASSPTLLKLTLSDYTIHSQKLFSDFLSRNKTLRDVSFENNVWKDQEPIEILEAALSNPSLQILNMKGSTISNNGFVPIIDYLTQNSNSLRKLNLRSTGMKTDTALLLVEALQHNNYFESLNIASNNGIENRFWKEFGNVMVNNTALRSLNVDFNNSAEMKSFLVNMRKNIGLTKLHLVGTVRIDIDNLVNIFQLMKMHKTLTKFLFPPNIDEDKVGCIDNYFEIIQGGISNKNLTKTTFGKFLLECISEGLIHKLDNFHMITEVLDKSPELLRGPDLNKKLNIRAPVDNTGMLYATIIPYIHINSLNFNETLVSHPDDVAVMLRSLELKTYIQDLLFSQATFEGRHAQSIGKLIENSNNLYNLTFTQIEWMELPFEYIGVGIGNNSTIRKLEISENVAIGEVGMMILADVIRKNKFIKTFTFTRCLLLDEWGAILAEALQENNSLECFDLVNNELGDKTLIALGAALPSNSGLATLHLQQNEGMGNLGILALFEGLKRNHTLRTLRLGDTKLDGEGLGRVIEVIGEIGCLEELGLSLPLLEEGHFEGIEKALSVNITISLDLKANVCMKEIFRSYGGLKDRVHVDWEGTDTYQGEGENSGDENMPVDVGDVEDTNTNPEIIIDLNPNTSDTSDRASPIPQPVLHLEPSGEERKDEEEVEVGGEAEGEGEVGVKEEVISKFEEEIKVNSDVKEEEEIKVNSDAKEEEEIKVNSDAKEEEEIKVNSDVKEEEEKI